MSVIPALGDLLNITPIATPIMEMLRPSDILAMFNAVMKNITFEEKKRYYRLDREVLKDTRAIDKCISQGGTVLVVGDSVKELLARYVTRYKRHTKQQDNHINVWVVFLSSDNVWGASLAELEREGGYEKHGYPPVMRQPAWPWHELGYWCCQDGVCTCRIMLPSGSGTFPGYSWYVSTTIAEDKVTILGNVGRVIYVRGEPDKGYRHVFEASVSLHCEDDGNRIIGLIQSRDIPHTNISGIQNKLLHAVREKGLITDHPPVLMTVLSRPRGMTDWEGVRYI